MSLLCWLYWFATCSFILKPICMSFCHGKCIRLVDLLSALIPWLTGLHRQSSAMILAFIHLIFLLLFPLFCVKFFFKAFWLYLSLLFFHSVFFPIHSFRSIQYHCRIYCCIEALMENTLSTDKNCHLPALCQIKSAVQLQILFFVRLQSIACLLHSIPFSAFSFPISPLTKAAFPRPRNTSVSMRAWGPHYVKARAKPPPHHL